MEYENPFSGLPNPAAFQDADIHTRAFMQGDRQRLMQPFMDMAQQRQQMEMKKKQMEMGEFASPEAIRARMTGLTKTADTNTFDAAKARADYERLPQEQKLKIAELSNKINDETMKPHRQLFEQMGMMADRIEAAPEQHRPILFQQELDRWQKLNPNSKIPDNLRQYSPQAMQELNSIRYALVHTPAVEQDIAKNAPKLASEESRYAAGLNKDLEVARIQGQTQRDVAGIRRDAAGKPMNESQHRVTLRQQLSDAELPQEERVMAEEELKGYLQKDIANEYKTRQLEVLQGQLSFEDIQNRVYSENGIKSKAGAKNKYEAGKTYEFKQGKMKFKGGNPQDEKNWEKVK